MKIKSSFSNFPILKLFSFLLVLSANFVNSQDVETSTQVPPPPCYANGNNGFGGAVGEGHFLKSDPNSEVWMSFFTGNGDPNEVNEINDILVMYIDTGAPGISEIDNNLDDSADVHRIAISNSNAFGNASVITFPPGFEASYALAINVDFGGLWSISNTGVGDSAELNFITSINSTLSSPQQEHFEINFDWADIGLTESDSFDFVGVYVSGTAYSSDEGYGNGINPGTQGSDDIIFNGYLSFPECNEVLNATESTLVTIEAKYYDNILHLEGINDKTRIRVYDILGNLVYSEYHHVQENSKIPLELNKKQLYFIKIQCANTKKVLKVLPH